MTKPLRILIVEDNAEDCRLVVRELNHAGIEFEWERVDTETAYLARLGPELDLILSDYQMPQFSGLRALELLKQRPPLALAIPFIIVSGTIGEETAVAAMQQGAADYLLKDRIGRLGPAVRRALQEVTEQRERKRLEAQFIEAQKMEVVGQLACGVAHDFNNVLAVILGYSDLIAQELGPRHPLLKYAEEVQHAAKCAAGLTRQLLIFSRKEAVQTVPLDLNEVVAGLDKLLLRLIDENIEMTIRCGEGIGPIEADPGYIWQVLMNLVVNARDAMPNGGKLAIETGAVTLDQAYADAHPGARTGDHVVLSVSDSGAGMSEEVKAHLFEAFFTTKPAGKGTGLGLATCRTIIRQCGGHIEVSSEVGRGTTFKIYFPKVEQPLARLRSSSQPAEPPRRGHETLLIVEDEPALRHLAERVLMTHGYHVLTAPNGQDALRVARENGGDPISLVITDVIMPRMGGKVMAEWLRSRYPDLKVLFTSGYTDAAVAGPGAPDEKVEFLPKPYSAAGLTRKVRDMLDAPAGREAAS